MNTTFSACQPFSEIGDVNGCIKLSNRLELWGFGVGSDSGWDGVLLSRNKECGTRSAWAWATRLDAWTAWAEFSVNAGKKVLVPVGGQVVEERHGGQLVDAQYVGGGLQLRDSHREIATVGFRSFSVGPRSVVTIQGEDVEIPPALRVDLIDDFVVRSTARSGAPPGELTGLISTRSLESAGVQVSKAIGRTRGWPPQRMAHFVEPLVRRRSDDDDWRDAEIAKTLVQVYQEHGPGAWKQPFMDAIGEKGRPEVIVYRLAKNQMILRGVRPYSLAYKARSILGEWD